MEPVDKKVTDRFWLTESEMIDHLIGKGYLQEVELKYEMPPKFRATPYDPEKERVNMLITAYREITRWFIQSNLLKVEEKPSSIIGGHSSVRYSMIVLRKVPDAN